MEAAENLKEGKQGLQQELHSHDNDGDIQVHVVEQHDAHNMVQPRTARSRCVTLRLRLRPLRCVLAFCAHCVKCADAGEGNEVEGILEGSHDMNEEDGGVEYLSREERVDGLTHHERCLALYHYYCSLL